MLLSLGIALMSAGPAQLPPAEVERLLERADKGDLSALNALSRARSKPVARRLCAGLDARAADRPETAARLAAIASAPDPACAKPVSAWLAGVKETEGPVPRRSLRAAIRVLSTIPPVGGGVSALARLSEHPEAELADAAVAAFATHRGLEAKPFVDLWTGALRRPGAMKAALTLLVRAEAKAAVDAILQAGLRHAESNPMRGAPEHVAALRAITGRDRGDAIEAWR